jgi:D-amino-acid dehydrogenase
MNAGRSVVVIGGGIIGIASAHFLNKAGYQVTVVDQGRIGQACSHGNCGLVCPSHVLPMAEPGAMASTLKALVRPHSPFRIRPRLDRTLWRWLWQFSRRCNETDMLASAAAIQPLLASSLKLYGELVSDEGLECEWQKQGLLFVYRHQAPLDAYARVNQLLATRFNEPAQRFDGPELCQFEPALRPGLAGGWYYEHDAHLRPDQLIASWRSLLEHRGVRFIEHQPLTALVATDGRVTAARLADQSLPGDRFLIATGAWTPQLASVLRVRLPIEPGKGYSVTVARPETCPAVPLIFPEHRVAVTPMKHELRLGSIMEFAGYDTSIRPERLSLLTDGASQYLRCELPTTFKESWYGWRPMTFDSTPVIGPCPGFTNVYLATGHNMLGMSMAPATGRLISELMAGTPPHLPAECYAATRFR